jgi:hypothetical protein
MTARPRLCEPTEMTDRLTIARALEDGGIGRDATEIFDAIHDNVATKADVAPVRAEVGALRTELKSDIALVEHRIMTRLGGVIAGRSWHHPRGDLLSAA